jgi:hypothetical protein
MSHAKEVRSGIARLVVGAALVVVAHAVLAQAPASPPTGKQGLQTEKAREVLGTPKK